TRHVGAGFEERRDRRAVRIDRKALRRRFELNAAWPARPYTETGASAAFRRGTARLRCGGRALALTCAGSAPARRAAVRAHPDAGEIRFAIRCSRRRRIESDLALCIARQV